MVDAPVAGSRPQAEAAELIYFVGGDAAIVEQVRPILLTMGESVHPLRSCMLIEANSLRVCPIGNGRTCLNPCAVIEVLIN